MRRGLAWCPVCAPRPEPTEAAADMKLARDAMAAGQTQTREVPCRGRAVRKGLAACLVCSLCLVGHEGMRNLGPTKAAADLKATQIVLALLQEVEAQADDAVEQTALTEADHQIIERIRERLRTENGGDRR